MKRFIASLCILMLPFTASAEYIIDENFYTDPNFGLDTVEAGELEIGETNATSVKITPPVTMSGALNLGSSLINTQVTSDDLSISTGDVDLSGASFLYLNDDTDEQVVHGLSGGVDGAVVFLNVVDGTSNSAVIKDNSATEGDPSNRIATPGNTDISLSKGSGLVLVYSDSRWRVSNYSPDSGSTGTFDTILVTDGGGIDTENVGDELWLGSTNAQGVGVNSDDIFLYSNDIYLGGPTTIGGGIPTWDSSLVLSFDTMNTDGYTMLQFQEDGSNIARTILYNSTSTYGEASRRSQLWTEMISGGTYGIGNTTDDWATFDGSSTKFYTQTNFYARTAAFGDTDGFFTGYHVENASAGSSATSVITAEADTGQSIYLFKHNSTTIGVGTLGAAGDGGLYNTGGGDFNLVQGSLADNILISVGHTPTDTSSEIVIEDGNAKFNASIELTGGTIAPNTLALDSNVLRIGGGFSGGSLDDSSGNKILEWDDDSIDANQDIIFPSGNYSIGLPGVIAYDGDALRTTGLTIYDDSIYGGYVVALSGAAGVDLMVDGWSVATVFPDEVYFSESLEASDGIEVTGGTAAAKTLAFASNVLRIGGGTSGGSLDDSSGNKVLEWDADSVDISQPVTVEKTIDEIFTGLVTDNPSTGTSAFAQNKVVSDSSEISLFHLGSNATAWSGYGTEGARGIYSGGSGGDLNIIQGNPAKNLRLSVGATPTDSTAEIVIASDSVTFNEDVKINQKDLKIKSSTGGFNIESTVAGSGYYAHLGSDDTGIYLTTTSSTRPFRIEMGGNDVAEFDYNSIVFDQNLTINGSLSKSSGSFKIPHPLPEKEDSHYLVHSFVEAPTADNIYRGSCQLVEGVCTVNIDTAAGMTEGTFVALNGNTQAFVSNESGWVDVRATVSGNTLTIEAEDSECTDTINWLVVGERHDKHMLETDWTDDDGHVIVEPEVIK